MCERSKLQQAPVYTDSMLEQMRRFNPPPPPPGKSDSWELQFCRWWGWNWVKKRENETCGAVTPPPKKLPRPCDEYKVKKKHFAELYNCLCFKKKPANTCQYRHLYRTPSNSTSHININYCGYLQEDKTNTPERLPSKIERKDAKERREKNMKTVGVCTSGMMQETPSANSELCKCMDSYEEGTLTCTSTEGSVEYVTIQHPCYCNCTSMVTEKKDKPVQNVTMCCDCDVQVEYSQQVSNCTCKKEAQKLSKIMQTSINNSDCNVQVGGQHCDCNKRSSNCPCQKAQKMTQVGRTQTDAINKGKKKRKIKIYCCHGCSCCKGCITELREGNRGTASKIEKGGHKSALVYNMQEPENIKSKLEKPCDPYEPLFLDHKKTFPSVGHISQLRSTLSDLMNYNRKLDDVSGLLSRGSEEFKRSMDNLLDLTDLEYETHNIDYLNFIPNASSRLMLDVMCDTIMNTETLNLLEDKATSMEEFTNNDSGGKLEELLVNTKEIHFDEQRNHNNSTFGILEAFQTDKIVLEKPDISITNIDFFLDFMLQPKSDKILQNKHDCCVNQVEPDMRQQEQISDQANREEIQKINGNLNPIEEKSDKLCTIEKEKAEKCEVKHKNKKKTMLPVRKTAKK